MLRKKWVLIMWLFLLLIGFWGKAWSLIIREEKRKFSVYYIQVSCKQAANSPQKFEGGKTDFGDPCDWQLGAEPKEKDRALIIFFKDVIDENLKVKDFEVLLEVLPDDKETRNKISNPTTTKPQDSWSKNSLPNSGNFNRVPAPERRGSEEWVV